MRLRLDPPARGSPARLPFLLLPVLAVAALVQLALPVRVDLPPAGATARIGQAGAVELPGPVTTPAALAERNLFVPIAAGAAGQAAAPPDPLGGARFAGVVQQGRQRLAVVQLGDGSVRRLAVGATIAGWRLIALTPAGARLTRGSGKTLIARYGAPPTSPRPQGARASAEEQ